MEGILPYYKLFTVSIVNFIHKIKRKTIRKVFKTVIKFVNRLNIKKQSLVEVYVQLFFYFLQ